MFNDGVSVVRIEVTDPDSLCLTMSCSRLFAVRRVSREYGFFLAMALSLETIFGKASRKEDRGVIKPQSFVSAKNRTVPL